MKKVVIALCLQAVVVTALAQSTAPRAELLSRIDSPYREELLRDKIQIPVDEQDAAVRAAATQPNGAMEVAIRFLGRSSDGIPFLLQQLKQDTNETHRQLILTSGLSGEVKTPRNAGVRDELQKTLRDLVMNDPSSAVSLEAARDYRRMQWGSQGALLDARIAVAKQNGDTAGEVALAKEADQWLGWDEQVNLPNFMRTPPPVFRIAPEGKAIRAVAIGDFGTGSPSQLALAKVMQKYNAAHPFDFGLTLGDNFYPRGVTSPDDTKWHDYWEVPYGPMGIRFYASLGNHDYIDADGPAAEIVYAQKSKTWAMPSTYYTYTAGSVQFFAIDTEEMSDTARYQRQIAWLDAELAKSKARWKVVYGHYQIYSATRGDEQNLIHRLLPVLKGRVDLYLCGHDHNMQQLKTEDGVHFFLSGGGGASLYDFRLPDYAHTTYKAKKNGFTVLEADDKQMTIRLIGPDGETLKSEQLK
jgi:tartrate-resistant acid phosphatase type 5